MSCESSLFTPFFPLTQVMTGAQGPKGDTGDAGEDGTTTWALNTTDPTRALDYEEEAGSPAYVILPFHAKPEAWLLIGVGGGAAVTPTDTSLPDDMDAFSYRRRFIHRDVGTTATTYYSQLEIKGVVELPSGTTSGQWETALTLPAAATPQKRINAVVPIVDSGDTANVNITTSGEVQVWLGSSPGSTIHLDMSQIRYEVEYS